MNTPVQRITSFPARLHRDERGTVSIMTVFAIFMFTILLVKVVNVGRHLDDKLRRQNAADAAAYSGGVVIARGMNTLAFTNHLEAEIFALDAYMRTAGMKNDNGDLAVADFSNQILEKWTEIGPIFEQNGGRSGFEKFEKLGAAITEKVPLEQDLVRTFSEMSARHSELTLPVLEYILHAGEGGSFGEASQVPEGGFIPRFQRALVKTIPQMADIAANEIARRYGEHGESMRRNGESMTAHMWRTDVYSLIDGNEDDPATRTMPAIDPSPLWDDGGRPDPQYYYTTAKRQRKSLAEHYRKLWIRDWQGPYFSYAGGGSRGRNRPGRDTAKMSQYINLFRTISCGHLRVLLEVEYPDTNLPHVIRKADAGMSPNDALERDHRFVAVTYWKHVKEKFPGLFKNRYGRDPGYDPQTFAQAAVFMPRRRFLCCPWAWPYQIRVDDGGGAWHWETRWRNNMERWPQGWDLLTQNWQTKLVPATNRNLTVILEQPPPGDNTFRPPNLGGTVDGDIDRISKH